MERLRTSKAWQEDAFLADFGALGFEDVSYADRSEAPWKIVEGTAFRSVTVTRPSPRREPEGGLLRLGGAHLPNNQRTRASSSSTRGCGRQAASP